MAGLPGVWSQDALEHAEPRTATGATMTCNPFRRTMAAPPREEKGRRLSVDSSVRGGNGEPTLLRFQSLRAKATASNVSPGGWFRENCDM
ncbi:hypothetical protein CN238_02615 [Sinorhizobium meliloti]|nr:hypothetical protein CN238_02615 [Sinorhizobium meliloti]RVH35984.1 hypothetical protein CN214_02010 [Sinorhizobium meliloti]